MELAGVQLGAHVTTLNVGQGTWGFAWEDGEVMDGEAAEHIREAVGVLGRYYDALGVRMFAGGADYEADRSDRLLHRFADASSVPVINLESAFYHPCQAMGDAGTLSVHFDGQVRRRRFVLAWAYHPRALPMAVPNSALLTAARLGMDVTVARPDSHALDPGVMDLAREYASASGGSVRESGDLESACADAEVVYAKAWGGPMIYDRADEEKEIRASLRDWRITEAHLAGPSQPVFMHCLPVRRNVVVDDAVLDGTQSIHLLQAEFRLHAQKAILEYVWGLEP
jgi:N-acetylornithine carbamoyltransferase